MLRLLSLLALVLLQDTALETVTTTRADGSKLAYEVDARGRKHGTYTVWHSDGSLATEGAFEDGLRAGTWTTYYPSGQVAETGPYENGQREGDWSAFHPDGSARSEGTYKYGMRHGGWTYWNADGTKDEDRSRGYKAVIETDEEGLVLRAGEMTGRKRNGTWRFYWPSTSEVQFEGNYDSDELTGRWVFRHADGSPDLDWISGYYDGDRLVGPLTAEDRAELAVEIEPDLKWLPDCDLGDVPGLQNMAGEFARLSAKQLAQLPPLESFAIPALVQGLMRRDLSSPDGVAAGAILSEACLPACFFGHRFDWANSVAPEHQAFNRTTIRRWHSAWHIVASNRAAWAELWERRPDEGEQRTLELHPRFLVDKSSAPSRRTRAIMTQLKKEKVDDALESALDWLVRHQSDDGSWDTDGFTARCSAAGRCDGGGIEPYDIGVTGLATLALLGAGPDFDQNPYAAEIVRATQWLVRQVDPQSGCIGAQTHHAFLYDHAVATTALALYARADASVMGALQRAVDFIHRARNPLGAWRYDLPPIGDNDTSMTGWMVHALHMAERVGARVDPKTFEYASKWFREMTDRETGRVGYTERGGSSSRVHDVNDDYPVAGNEGLTAVALFARYLMGQTPDDFPEMELQSELLLEAQPDWFVEGFMPDVGSNDYYYWFYGTYAMFQVGGRDWEKWNRSMKRALLDSQVQPERKRKPWCAAGSWDPNSAWGFAGGRVYATALLAMCLEVYHRYERVGD